MLEPPRAAWRHGGAEPERWQWKLRLSSSEPGSECWWGDDGGIATIARVGSGVWSAVSVSASHGATTPPHETLSVGQSFIWSVKGVLGGEGLQHRATWLLTIIPLSTSQFIIHLVNGVISQLLSRSLIGFHYGMHYLFNFYQFGFCSWSLLPVVSHPADINDCSKDYNNSCTNILSWWGGSGINLFFLCWDEEQNWASDKWTGDNLDKTEINHQNTK